MPQSLPAPLESGQDAVVGAEDIAIVGICILQARGGVEHGEHLPGIIRPVRGQLQFASGLQQAAQHCRKIRLDKTTFLLPLFRPWVRKLNDDAAQKSVRQSLQPSDRIVVDDPDVVGSGLHQLQQQGPDAGCMHLDADAAPSRPLRGDGGQVLTVTKAYFQHKRPLVIPGIPPFGMGIYLSGWQIFRNSPCLGSGDAALAQDETADGPMAGLERFFHDRHYNAFGVRA